MTGSSRRFDRVLLIGAVALVAVAVIASSLLRSAGQESEDEQVASSWHSGPGGAKATYLLLGELGYDVRRSERSPAQLDVALDAPRTVLVLAQPTRAATEAERRALLQFVYAGGRLLFAGDDEVLSEARRGRHDTFPDSVIRFERVAIEPRSARAPWIRMRPLASLHAAGATVLYAHDGQTAVATWRYGAGRVVWWAGVTPLTNRGLELDGNLPLLLDALGPVQDRVVQWDEYFHGERGSVLGYLVHSPLAVGLVQGLLLFVLACLTFARRTSPVRVPADESRASMLEFVDAMGGLYERAGAASEVVRLALDWFRARLASRVRLPASSPDAALVAAVRTRLGRGDAQLGPLLAHASRAAREPGTSNGEALGLIVRMDRWDRHVSAPAGTGRMTQDNRRGGS